MFISCICFKIAAKSAGMNSYAFKAHCALGSTRLPHELTLANPLSDCWYAKIKDYWLDQLLWQIQEIGDGRDV